MGTVNVVVNGRPYSVGCEDGQEAHVEALARDFDRQVLDVGGQVGQVGDIRLFLMAALVSADELADAKLQLAKANVQLAHRAADQSELRQRAAEALDGAAERIEAITAQLD